MCAHLARWNYIFRQSQRNQPGCGLIDQETSGFVDVAMLKPGATDYHVSSISLTALGEVVEWRLNCPTVGPILKKTILMSGPAFVV